MFVVFSLRDIVLAEFAGNATQIVQEIGIGHTTIIRLKLKLHEFHPVTKLKSMISLPLVA